jgi:glycogen operon protein
MDVFVNKALFCGFGVKKDKKSMYFCAYLPFLRVASINFYDINSKKPVYKLDLTEDMFLGDVLCINVSGLDFDMLSYRYQTDDKEFIDPYSKAVDLEGNFSLFQKEKPYKDFDNDKNPRVFYEDSYFYLTSVKGSTMLDPKASGKKGTFKALESKLSYYKKLGVTSIVLMPVYEVLKKKLGDENSIENQIYSYKEDKSKENLKKNYWGFGAGLHFAIKKEYVSSDYPAFEFKHFIKTYHDAGMEIILMMQYENASKDYILNSLKYYVTEFHIDGFRLIGLNIPMDDILSDPMLKKTKIIYDNYDFNSYDDKSALKYKVLASSNNLFMNSARKFLKSDEDMVSYLSYAVRENSRFYSPLRFITDFSGFSLYDLVSFNVKHNEENGEDNTDGTDYNYSWNCGIEGETKKKSILSLRKQQVRNAFLLMMLTQGAPLIKGGDELLNTQFGNNNPYCQDNETGWIKYRKDKTALDFYNFTKNLISFRKRHSILHQPKELMLFDYMSCKFPDVSFHGREAFKMDQTPVSRAFGVLYYGDYAKQYKTEKEESIYIVYNMYWEDCEFALPEIKAKKHWRLLYSSDLSTDESFKEDKALIVKGDKYLAKKRSISILIN